MQDRRLTRYFRLISLLQDMSAYGVRPFSKITPKFHGLYYEETMGEGTYEIVYEWTFCNGIPKILRTFSDAYKRDGYLINMTITSDGKYIRVYEKATKELLAIIKDGRVKIPSLEEEELVNMA